MESDDGDSTGNVKSLSQPVHTPRRSQCRPLPATCSITLNTILSRPGLSNGELETSHTNLITFPIPRHPCSILPYGMLRPKIVHYRNVIIGSSYLRLSGNISVENVVTYLSNQAMCPKYYHFLLLISGKNLRLGHISSMQRRWFSDMSN